jgi:hypothetical protein
VQDSEDAGESPAFCIWGDRSERACGKKMGRRRCGGEGAKEKVRRRKMGKRRWGGDERGKWGGR